MPVAGSDNSVLDRDVQSKVLALLSKINDPGSYAGSFAQALEELKNKATELKDKSEITHTDWTQLNTYIVASNKGFSDWEKDINTAFGNDVPVDVQTALTRLGEIEEELAQLSACVTENIPQGTGGDHYLNLTAMLRLACTMQFDKLTAKQEEAEEVQQILQQYFKPKNLWNIIPSDSYYLQRLTDFKKRYPNATPPEYYLCYGDKYLNRFKYDLRPNLSAQGQQWLDGALQNLQEAIELKIVGRTPKQPGDPDINIKLENFNFQQYVFDSHVKAYVDAGLLQLSIIEKVKIALTPDCKDLFSSLGLKQAKDVGVLQAKYYLDNPGFAAVQVKEAYDNWDRIVQMASDYCERQKNAPQPQGCAPQTNCVPCDAAEVIDRIIKIILII
jgi:hypothetical protein